MNETEANKLLHRYIYLLQILAKSGSQKHMM